MLFSKRKPPAESKPSEFERLLLSGESIKVISSQQLLDLYRDTSIVSSIFLVVDGEVQNRIQNGFKDEYKK